MNPTVEAALIGAAVALIGDGGTVIVAITSARNTRRTNQATIDAAHADAKLTLEAAREAQYADRYSRALEQLGSDAQGIRIGGILAQEGLALDSPRNHPTVMEVLVAYIREHTKGRAEDNRSPRADVQAALSVVARRKAVHDIRPIDLNNTDLRGADITGANLRGAILTKVNLAHATLSMVDLTRANLWGADLSATALTSSSLAAADLVGANLAGSLLMGVDVNFVTDWLAARGGSRLPDPATVDAAAGILAAPRDVSVSVHPAVVWRVGGNLVAVYHFGSLVEAVATAECSCRARACASTCWSP